MALNKEITDANGITATYWVAEPRIDNVTSKQTTVILYGWATRQHRADKAKPIMTRRVQGKIDSVEPTWSEIYSFCKKTNMTIKPDYWEGGDDSVTLEIHNDFADAEDVLER